MVHFRWALQLWVGSVVMHHFKFQPKKNASHIEERLWRLRPCVLEFLRRKKLPRKSRKHVGLLGIAAFNFLICEPHETRYVIYLLYCSYFEPPTHTTI